MTRAIALPLLAGLLVGCNWEECADKSVDFELVAPGDAVDILVQACGPARRRDIELSITLTPDPSPDGPLAITVDGIGISPADRGWAGAYDDLATDVDCDPGRRVNVRRIDSDPAVRITGTLSAEMSAPPHRTCVATLTVIPK